MTCEKTCLEDHGSRPTTTTSDQWRLHPRQCVFLPEQEMNVVMIGSTPQKPSTRMDPKQSNFQLDQETLNCLCSKVPTFATHLE